MYDFVDRRLITSNSRFDLFFDKIYGDFGCVPDYLVVKPKVSQSNDVVGVLTIPIVSGRIALMRVWRHHQNTYLWQAPAGFVEKDESVSLASLRELREELGFHCDKSNHQFLGYFYPDAALIQGKVALFCATACEFSTDNCNAEVGVGKVSFFTPPQAFHLMRNEPISGATAYALSSLFLPSCSLPTIKIL